MSRFRSFIVPAAFVVSLLCLIGVRLIEDGAPRHVEMKTGYTVMRLLEHENAPPEAIWLSVRQARIYDLTRRGAWTGPVVAVAYILAATLGLVMRRRSGW